MKYFKQLDSVRAIAVLLVIISHWIPGSSLVNKLPNGEIGVDIFFVLSGFLITRILFENRLDAEAGKSTNPGILKSFYIRRTLRIFPIYYITLFVLLFFREHIHSNLSVSYPYFLTYTSNIYFFKIQAWDGPVSHFWSLAVEEQFYLLWPWLILFIRRKYLLPLIILFIFTGIAGQLLLSSNRMGKILTFACFDAFGFGALLAWFITFRKEKAEHFFSWLKWGAVVSFIVFAWGVYKGSWNLVPLRTLVSVMSLWLIAFIVIRQQSAVLLKNPLLNNPVMIYLGKISYGLYLYHNLVTVLNLNTVDKYLNPLLPDFIYKNNWGYLYLLENIILLLLISWASYVLIEQRFLNLKKYFSYGRR